MTQVANEQSALQIWRGAESSCRNKRTFLSLVELVTMVCQLQEVRVYFDSDS